MPILFYLAEGSAYLPDASWDRARILQWLCFEQYNHEPNIAVARFWHFAGKLDEHRDELPVKMERGYHALDVMEQHLTDNAFFAGAVYSIADISLYAYTHVADEGGFDLQRYPAVRAWLGRVAAQPGHVLITDEVGQLVEWP